jgi:hypothetical protein
MAVATRLKVGGSGARRKRVLLAWETGAGRTHYGNLLAIATHLRASGIECLAALYDNTAADREFAAIGVRTIQNYVWPSQRGEFSGWVGNPTHAFTDMLAAVGYKSASAVAAAIAHYDGLFSLFEPDLVVCEHAWGALLASRDVIPAVATGFCVRLPPIIDGGFPIYPGRSGVAVPVAELLATVNQGMAIAGRFPLRDIGDLLRVAAVIPQGLPEFDFYSELRSEPILPPMVPGLAGALREEPGDEAFIYLHAGAQQKLELVEGLAQLAQPAFAYIPNLTSDTRKKLPRLAVADAPVSVKEIFRRARCVVHQGGEQLTTACLAAGLPQVILSTWMDTRVTGGFVKAHGFGDTMPMREVTAEWLVEAVSSAYGDSAMRDRCRAARPRFRELMKVDTPALIARRICELIGQPFTAGRYPGVDQ